MLLDGRECHDNNDYNDSSSGNCSSSEDEDERENENYGNGDETRRDGGGQKLPVELAAIKSAFARLGRASHNSHTQVIAIHCCCCRCCFHFHFRFRFRSFIRSLESTISPVCLPAARLTCCLPAYLLTHSPSSQGSPSAPSFNSSSTRICNINNNTNSQNNRPAPSKKLPRQENCSLSPSRG